jgi:hypothetical protein
MSYVAKHLYNVSQRFSFNEEHSKKMDLSNVTATSQEITSKPNAVFRMESKPVEPPLLNNTNSVREYSQSTFDDDFSSAHESSISQSTQDDSNWTISKSDTDYLNALEDNTYQPGDELSEDEKHQLETVWNGLKLDTSSAISVSDEDDRLPNNGLYTAFHNFNVQSETGSSLTDDSDGAEETSVENSTDSGSDHDKLESILESILREESYPL